MVLFVTSLGENSKICLVTVAVLGVVEVVLLISVIANVLLILCEFIIIILMIGTRTNIFIMISALKRHTSTDTPHVT